MEWSSARVPKGKGIFNKVCYYNYFNNLLVMANIVINLQWVLIEAVSSSLHAAEVFYDIDHFFVKGGKLGKTFRISGCFNNKAFNCWT